MFSTKIFWQSIELYTVLLQNIKKGESEIYQTGFMSGSKCFVLFF